MTTDIPGRDKHAGYLVLGLALAGSLILSFVLFFPGLALDVASL